MVGLTESGDWISYGMDEGAHVESLELLYETLEVAPVPCEILLSEN